MEIETAGKKEQTRSETKLPRNVWILTFTSFFTDISSDMILNLIPLFLANVLGAGTAVVGVIEGIAETTASIMKLFSGAISDKLKQRKSLAVIGYGLSSLSKPFLLLANSWGWVLGVRFSDRLGKGIRTAPKDALLAGSVDEKNRGLAFGVHRAGDTAGAFLGVAIAAFVIWRTQVNLSLLSGSTFHTIVLISIIPAFLAVAVIAFGARDVLVKSQSDVPILSWKGLDKRFQFYIFVTILFTLGNSSDAFITLRAQERGLNILQIMLMLMTFNAIYAALSGPLGALSDRLGRRRLIIIGWITYGLIYLGFGLSTGGTAIWILFSLYGIYYALTEGSGKALIADLVPDEKRGTAYGIYYAAVGLTALPASVIAGLLWQGFGAWTGFGAAAPFYFGAGMALIAGLLFALRIKS
jgi:MFS family permease